jgi:biopolymer transport protein ExbD
VILRRRVRRKGRIEIIPMIDTVFFLLVFFMMASLSMTMNRGLPVNLPAAGSGERERREPVALTLTRVGELYLDRVPVTLESLPARLRRALATNSQLVGIVNADREVPHGRVVAVMDAARQAGVARLAIAVEPGELVRRTP